MKYDLKNKTRKELEKLRSNIDKALGRLAAEDKKKALAAADKAARAHGYSLSELTAAKIPVAAPAKPRKPMAKVEPKYCNPNDPTQTWTGRGRQPNWMKEALAAGKTLQDMAI